jgi:hypothetical protein
MPSLHVIPLGQSVLSMHGSPAHTALMSTQRSVASLQL